MSTFSDASLVYVPSGVKEGKTYSIKPTDGSGDLTFSRGSDIEATRVAANGYIQKAQVNLLLQSNQFDTTWTTSNASVTSGQADKDGGTTAWKIDKSAAGGYITQSISLSGVQSFSVYAKAGTTDWMVFLITGYTAYYDLANGVVGSAGSAPITNIESVGGGWYRCTLTASASTTSVRIYPAEGDGDTSGTSGNIYIQDAQLNYGLVAQTYQETTTAAVVSGITDNMPRLNYDPANPTCPSLLLEGSRTNLVTQSELFSTWSATSAIVITPNDTTSPEGVTNGAKATENTATAGHYVSESFSLTAASHTFSIFAKAGERNLFLIRQHTLGLNATFNLSNGTIGTVQSGLTATMEDYGGGWYRCSVTFTATAATHFIRLYITLADNSTSSYTGDGTSGLYLYGAQLELGSYSSSLIPTYGASATRTTETVSVNPSTLLGATQGSWFLNFANMSFDISGTSGPSIFIGYNESNYLGITNRSLGNVTQVLFCKRESGSITNLHTITSQSGNDKFCFTWNGSSMKLFVNGVKVYDDTSFANFISWLNLNMGNASRTPQYNNKQTLLFPTQISDADAIALTA